MNYRDLEVWPLARQLVIDIHEMTLTKLPKLEAFEEASQIRRAMKSVKACIVESYGRRNYKQEFIRFLTYALASCDGTMDHLDTLVATGSLKDKVLSDKLAKELEQLGKKLNLFLQSVERGHKSNK
jgi:four helix bundle protein